MNILNRYIIKGDKKREEYAYTLINLFEYAKIKQNEASINNDIDDELYWKEKLNKYKKNIAKHILKGLK